jgi:hypothetical protein
MEGTYEFELTVMDNRGATASDVVKIEVQLAAVSKVSIYPNPVVDIVNIKIEASTHANNTSLVIYDATGRAVYAENFMRTQGIMIKTLNVSFLTKGTYVIEIGADINNKVSVKMIKQ